MQELRAATELGDVCYWWTLTPYSRREGVRARARAERRSSFTKPGGARDAGYFAPRP